MHRSYMRDMGAESRKKKIRAEEITETYWSLFEVSPDNTSLIARHYVNIIYYTTLYGASTAITNQINGLPIYNLDRLPNGWVYISPNHMGKYLCSVWVHVTKSHCRPPPRSDCMTTGPVHQWVR
jgi:hypothetical protein